MLYGKKRTVLVWGFLFLICLMFKLMPVSAETKQAEIITMDQQRDLAVMFTFDKEVVDIVFVSPSGEEKRASDPDVDYVGGDLWSTYRIFGAEAGTWLVQYDLKSNSGINYSIIEDDYGLWIQYVGIYGTDGEKIIDSGENSGTDDVKTTISEQWLKVRFEADCESEALSYDYTLYAVDTTDAGASVRLASGTAWSGDEESLTVRLTSLSSGSYALKLEVYHRADGAEVFDSVTTEPFIYTNPKEPGMIENFALDIDVGNLTCAVNWKAFFRWSYDSYKLSVYGDAELLYSGELEKSVTSTAVVFPEGTQQLTVELCYKDDGIWSKPLSKTVDLNREYIRLVTGKVTSASQATLKYHVMSERLLELSVNGTKGSFSLRDEGELSFDLQQGNNLIHAGFESEPLICFVTDEEIYLDAYPPEIKLYEDLDGKTFYDDSVDILGRMTGGSRLLVNDSEAVLGENGEFRINAALTVGENILSIQALDVNGNSALLNLTLYRASGGMGADGSKGGALWFLPLLAALFASLVIILLSAVFMKKKARVRNAGAIRLWKWILWDSVLAVAEAACICGFIIYYRRVNSMAFLEMVEKSVSGAVQCLRLEKVFEIASLGVFIMLALSIAITIIRKKKRDKGAESGTGSGRRDLE